MLCVRIILCIAFDRLQSGSKIVNEIAGIINKQTSTNLNYSESQNEFQSYTKEEMNQISTLLSELQIGFVQYASYSFLQRVHTHIVGHVKS